MKTYKLESRAMYWFYSIVMPCLAIATGVGWIVIRLAQPPGVKGVGVWFGLLWLAWVAWALYRYVTMPHTIEVSEQGLMRFVGAFRTIAVIPSDVASVQTFAGQFVYVKYTGGKILLLQQFTGFHEFLTALKQANPGVTMRGV